jgi:hypothetical protein
VDRERGDRPARLDRGAGRRCTVSPSFRVRGPWRAGPVSRSGTGATAPLMIRNDRLLDVVASLDLGDELERAPDVAVHGALDHFEVVRPR